MTQPTAELNRSVREIVNVIRNRRQELVEVTTSSTQTVAEAKEMEHNILGMLPTVAQLFEEKMTPLIELLRKTAIQQTTTPR